MEALAVHDIRVIIFYGHFVLRDVWCDAGDDGESLRVSREQIVAASTYQVTIQARSHVAGLRIRLWDGEPEQDSGTWDGCRQFVLHCPTGELLVEQITSGAAAEVRLPQGAGVYGLRIHWADQEAVQKAIMGVYQRLDGQPQDALTAALRELDGTERFLIDAWWQRPLPPDDDDDEFHSDDWI
ncbi:hypothetical protein ABT346_26775 [Micromonospora peucetia]|uniref:hypothetical protein n=1 Tax=Micromonospora peucetia TaxID=47871 RepID=UPI00332B7105